MAITKATASSVAPAAKGDLVVGSGTNDAAVLAVGTNDYVLTAASGETTGLKWAAAASPSYTWTAYTPTIVSGTGTLTTASASGRYLKIDKFIFVTISATVTTNGTGASNILISAPFSAVNLGSTALFRENAVTGNIGQVYISGSNFTLTTTTNTYPAANGYQFVFGIGYEVA